MEQGILQQILAKIENMDNKINDISVKQTSLVEEMKNLSAEQVSFGEQLNDVSVKQHELKIIVENQNDKSIKTIAEGHSILNEKLDKIIGLEETVDQHEDRIGALEYKVKNA